METIVVYPTQPRQQRRAANAALLAEKNQQWEALPTVRRQNDPPPRYIVRGVTGRQRRGFVRFNPVLQVVLPLAPARPAVQLPPVAPGLARWPGVEDLANVEAGVAHGVAAEPLAPQPAIVEVGVAHGEAAEPPAPPPIQPAPGLAAEEPHGLAEEPPVPVPEPIIPPPQIHQLEAEPPPPTEAEIAIQCGPGIAVLQPGQIYIPLKDNEDHEIVADVGVQFEEPPVMVAVEVQCEMDEHVDQELAPTAPPLPTYNDVLKEVAEERAKLYYDKRPVPAYYGMSSVNTYNCLPNKEFSHLPRFKPHYMRLGKKVGKWERFKRWIDELKIKSPFAFDFPGIVSDPVIELDLYYQLMLEMAFCDHTTRSLLMLKTKARRYLAQFDCSLLSSADMYSIIFHTCLAAYFTAGQASFMLEHQSRHVGDVAAYQEALSKY